MSFSRRKFLTLAGVSAASVTMVSPLEAFYARVARGQAARGSGFGQLEPKLPLNAYELTNTYVGDLSQKPLLELPPGFNYRAFSITGQTMSDGSLVPERHDGMAAFPGSRNTTILVRNHEAGTSSPYPVSGSPRYSAGAQGGTTTLVIGSNREVIKDFASLAGTIRNCAGGPTPWGSWISCEETFSVSTNVLKDDTKHGYNFEVIANANSGLVTPVPLKDMGRFSHEAIAVDPKTGYVYETEDRTDSCFYRFVPNVNGKLAEGGTLWALKIKGAENFALNTTNNPNFGGEVGKIKVGQTFDVEWVKIDQPDPETDTVRKEAQSEGAAIFFRGEGAWYGNDVIYFVATQAGTPAVDATNGRGNGQVWIYDPRKEKLTLYVEADSSGELLDEPDNVTVTPFGDIFLCEDGGGVQYVVGVNKKGELYQFAKNVISDAEFAGGCFSPDGRTFFVNIYNPGITCAIWGPWERHRSS
ncbi:alkaline phosphatase PhoX [Chlorogloeopsis sp. ULAP02]|uniref:alkaline phosphatase PhoX n=1 Tax=Chlorogloeopsis sp. ULAP02 TaxID=3107926 RepID=UPI0031358C98